MAKWTEIMQKIGEALGLLQSKMARLEGQREAAQADFAKARAVLSAHIDSDNAGDRTITAALKAEIVGARVEIELIDEKIQAQIALVTAEENRLLDEETRSRNNASADEILDIVTKVNGKKNQMLASVRDVAAELAKLATFRVGASGISEFLANAANEAEIALAHAIPDMLTGVEAVREGRERPPAKPGAIIKMVAPAPTTARVYLTASVAWYDDKGAKFRAPAMNDCDLPLTLIAKGKGIGAVHELTSDVRRKSHGSRAPTVPAWEHCRWLNSDPTAKSAAEPILSSSPRFDPHPNPRQTVHGTMRQPAQPQAATRSIDGGGKGGRR